VKGINRTDDDWRMATARVHAVVRNRAARVIGARAFIWCSNLVRVTASFVEEVVGVGTFHGAYNLRHITLSPDVVVYPAPFVFCLSLQVLSASVGFQLDTGDKGVEDGEQ